MVQVYSLFSVKKKSLLFEGGVNFFNLIDLSRLSTILFDNEILLGGSRITKIALCFFCFVGNSNRASTEPSFIHMLICSYKNHLRADFNR
jgi:hypothetical protein